MKHLKMLFIGLTIITVLMGGGVLVTMIALKWPASFYITFILILSYVLGREILKFKNQ